MTNSDGSLNSPSHPALPGTYVTLYLTGTGQTNRLVQMEPLPQGLRIRFFLFPSPSVANPHNCYTLALLRDRLTVSLRST